MEIGNLYLFVAKFLCKILLLPAYLLLLSSFQEVLGSSRSPHLLVVVVLLFLAFVSNLTSES